MDLVGKTMMVRENVMRHHRDTHVYMTQKIYDVRGKPGVVVEKHIDMPIYRIKIGENTIGWIQDDWLVPVIIDNRSL